MDDELRKKLASWKVEPEIPPDFQSDVWRRIAAREEATRRKAPFLSFLTIRWVSLPRLATFAFILAGLTGTGLGLVESSRANTKNWKTLEAKYVQSIDPYQHLGTY